MPTKRQQNGGLAINPNQILPPIELVRNLGGFYVFDAQVVDCSPILAIFSEDSMFGCNITDLLQVCGIVACAISVNSTGFSQSMDVLMERPIPESHMALIKKYDLDQSGIISSEEIERMIKDDNDVLDSNGNGKVSKEELQQFVLRLTRATAGTQTLSAAFVSKLIPETDDFADWKATSVLAKFDANENEILEATELALASWSPEEDLVFDQDGDGALSKLEIANRYRFQFAAASIMLQNDPRLMKALSIKAISSPKKGGQATNEAVGGIAAGNAFQFGFVPAGNPKQQATESVPDKKRVESKNIHLKIGLLRIGDISGDELKQLRSKIQDLKFANFEPSIRNLNNSESVILHDLIQFSAIDDAKTKISNGGVTAQKSAVSSSRNGEKVYNYNMVETGITLETTPRIIDNYVEVALDLRRSFLDQSTENEQPFSPAEIRTFQLESTIACEINKTVTFSSEQPDGLWLVIVAVAVN